jgi:hypothetical protein
MGLFRRKDTSESEAERCPYCREPVPDGAVECMMCGAALPARAVPNDEETEPAEASRPGAG